jgi:hypothetical protein
MERGVWGERLKKSFYFKYKTNHLYTQSKVVLDKIFRP